MPTLVGSALLVHNRDAIQPVFRPYSTTPNIRWLLLSISSLQIALGLTPSLGLSSTHHNYTGI